LSKLSLHLVNKRFLSTSTITVTKPVVAYWLYFNAGMVFSIVIVGGLTRLTESGLSIVEWNVISGMKPPRSEQEWLNEFEKYKQYPEYKLYVSIITTIISY
jgi:cytochrome c oxidase assembly protein subunit 15